MKKTKYPLFPTWEQSIYNQPKLVSDIIKYGQVPLALLIKRKHVK